MYSCIIIDDDQYAIDGLRGYIEAVPHLELVQTYSDSQKALKINDRASVDIIFMDIEMPKINGIELSKMIRYKTRKLVFTTAHPKYAYDAFEVVADAYLLKPYGLGKFLSTLDRLLKSPKQINFPDESNFFFVKSKEENLKIVKIRYNEVVAVESKLNYVLIHTLQRQILTYMSLTEIGKVLSAYSNFIQLHRSYIIAANHVETINGNAITMANGLEVIVGEIYRKDFSSFISNNLINTGKKK